MKKIVCLVLLIVNVATNSALADDSNQLAKDLMNVLGFNSMLESLRQESTKMVQGQMDKMILQIRQSNPNIDDEINKELNSAAQEFVIRVMNSWNTTEASKIYTTAIIQGLPEKDMRAAIDHYQTPEGQRELKVITAAAQSMNNYVLQSTQKESEAAMKDFLSRLRSIAARIENKKDKVQVPLKNN